MNNKYLDAIENELKSRIECLVDNDYKVLNDAMLYSVSAGGKRIRPWLLIKCFELFDRDWQKALGAACSVEYIHTYSLIHDDLPCMDNDDFRRGKPSCHKQFGEDTALLAGDALLTLAFNALASCDLPSSRVVKAISYLSDFSGVSGMVGGQVIDLSKEDNDIDIDTVLKMYSLKTSALIKAACCCGAVLAGACSSDIQSVSEYALNLGIAFQIQDDILDVVGDSQIIGKPVGSDAQNDKTNFVTILGLDKAKKAVELYSDKAKMALKNIDSDTSELEQLVDKLISREK